MPTKDQVIDALRNCMDPELHIDVWTLEIIYDIQISDEGSVYIKMTFTTPFCPYGPALVKDIETKVKAVEGVKDVQVEVVFDPPWKPSDDLLDMMAMGIQ